MDHWGDPWADDADKSPPKNEIEVKSPPPTISNRPVILNGFLDDARWGSVEDDSAAWTDNTPNGSSEALGWGATERDDTIPEPVLPKLSEDIYAVKETVTLAGFNDWGQIGDNWEPEPEEQDQVVSDTSDSATTIQPEDVPGRLSTNTIDVSHPDDDLSTRPSTSPSDVSLTEAPTESPRTSFEDEHVAEKTSIIENDAEPETSPAEDVVVETSLVDTKTGEGEVAEDGFGDFEDNAEETSDPKETDEPVGISSEPEKEQGDVSPAPDSEPEPPPISSTNVTFTFEPELMSQLFPPPKETKVLDDAPDDPIHNTSTRKAWYRLTRKQTMREFNYGNDYDNYIRVNWAISHIRSEATKIVGKWATDDRIAGRGPGARASFYWDQGAAPDPKPLNQMRKKPSISAAIPQSSVNKTVPQLSTNLPAAFDWSSPSAASPGNLNGEGARSVSSPMAAKHSAIAKLQRQEGRALSVDLTPKTKGQPTHRRTATESDIVNGLPVIAPPPMSQSPQSPAAGNPWEDAKVADFDVAPAAEDDDDEWGEMIQSPAVGTPTTEFFQIPSQSTLITPFTAPIPTQPPPLPLSGSKHASPIVHLKRTVSPTSSTFKFNSFVPASLEEGPIGPGLLKRPRKSRESTPERKRPESRLEPQGENLIPNIAEQKEESNIPPTQCLAPEPTKEDDFSMFESPKAVPEHTTAPKDSFSTFEPLELELSPPSTKPTTHADSPTVQTPVLATDPWDLSIFESALPAVTPTPTPPPAFPSNPSDPWSIFDTPAPAVSPTKLNTSTPPPTHSTASPLTQPPTSANSSQKQKEDEERIIQGIITGLPDFAYMLQR